MFKVTPNPPAKHNAAIIDSRIADRALAHHNLGPDAGTEPNPLPAVIPPCNSPTLLGQEEVLVDIHSILQSAAATAYENADNQTGPNRKVAMGVVYLIELAQSRMDQFLNGQSISASS
ncbi:hypothetical protein PF66_05812 [Pseudomonas asplenii]|uniref:DUF3077 domain-containing protein n=1 Tax=Pseudomonas asplenii TaxID=53407 RepID=A0A0M9GCX2_9PSED|nr:hypothetical protein [Pseudomonas fuscovaginae]KPA87854.1 hypothetical protein PF66_05812 [Pseudomonas fuscovaginae]